MRSMRRARFSGLLMVLAVLLGGCGVAAVGGPRGDTGPAASPTVPADVTAMKRAVVLGDSVTTGSTCHCAPFPNLLAERLSAATGHTVGMTNDGVDGSDTAFLLSSLGTDPDVRGDVKAADLVVVTIGANDLTDIGTRTPDGSEPCPASCYAPEADRAAVEVGKVVARVKRLAPSARIVVTDYWNVFTDGATVDSKARAYNTEVTRAFDDALHTVVSPTGATFVDLVEPFRQASAGDPTPLLLGDGDHPSAEGHRVIAEAIMRELGVPAATEASPTPASS